MDSEIILLVGTAASAGFLHTLFGPDHYLPFIMMGSARKWTRRKTLTITLLCGVGHIAGSVILGLIGVAAGLALNKMVGIESFRGELAGWLLLSFGLVYMLWGLRQAWRDRPHKHWHAHADGVVHTHEHTHHGEHAHVHEKQGKAGVTPWALFIIFVLGPCEVLIPLLMVPAAQHSVTGLLLVTSVFGLTTLATMVAAVLAGMVGVRLLPVTRLQRYAHALAGGAICLCGVAMQFLGL